jgi:hypothetical protein
MAIVDEVRRLGLAAERGEMSAQEAVSELLKVARLTPLAAAGMIRDWRGAVERYEDAGRRMVEATAELARMAGKTSPLTPQSPEARG